MHSLLYWLCKTMHSWLRYCTIISFPFHAKFLFSLELIISLLLFFPFAFCSKYLFLPYLCNPSFNTFRPIKFSISLNVCRNLSWSLCPVPIWTGCSLVQLHSWCAGISLSLTRALLLQLPLFYMFLFLGISLNSSSTFVIFVVIWKRAPSNNFPK